VTKGIDQLEKPGRKKGNDLLNMFSMFNNMFSKVVSMPTREKDTSPFPGKKVGYLPSAHQSSTCVISIYHVHCTCELRLSPHNGEGNILINSSNYTIVSTTSSDGDTNESRLYNNHTCLKT